MTITLREVIRAAAVRQAPVTGELAGYLVLGAADQLALAPARATAEGILLEQDGTLRIAAQGGANERQAVLGLGRVLVELTEVARPSAPALESLAGQSLSLAAFIRRVEAALIPVNRSAARRALARLYRETHRAKVSGYLQAQRAVVAEVASDADEEVFDEDPLPSEVDVAVEAIDEEALAAAPETESEPTPAPLPRLPEVVEITLRVPEVELAPAALAGFAGAALRADCPTGALWERTPAIEASHIVFEFDEPEAQVLPASLETLSIVSTGPSILDCTPRFGSVLWPAQPTTVEDGGTATASKAEQTPADPTLYARVSFDDIPPVLQPFSLVVDEPFVMPLPIEMEVAQEQSEVCDEIVPELCDEIVPELAPEPDEEIPLLLVSRRKPRPSDVLDEFDAMWDTIDWDGARERTRSLVKTPLGPEPVLAVPERDEVPVSFAVAALRADGPAELTGEECFGAEVDGLLDALTAHFESHGAHATDVQDVDEASVAPSDAAEWSISMPFTESECDAEAVVDFSAPPPIASFDDAVWGEESDGEEARAQSTEAEALVPADPVSDDSSGRDTDGLFDALTSHDDAHGEVAPEIQAVNEASVAPSEPPSNAQDAELGASSEVIPESVPPIGQAERSDAPANEPVGQPARSEAPADEAVVPLPAQAEAARFTPPPSAPISVAPEPEARVGSSRPWYRPRRSDLSDLLQRFGARHTRSERRVSHDLQRMVGIDLTPASGSPSGTPPPVMVDEHDAGAPPTARRSWGRRVALYSTVSAIMLLAVAGAHRSRWVPGAANASRAECHATVTIDALAPGSRVRVRKQRSTEPLADRTAQNASLAVPGLPCREALEVIVTRPGGARWLRVPVESQALTPQPGADLASATITAR